MRDVSIGCTSPRESTQLESSFLRGRVLKHASHRSNVEPQSQHRARCQCNTRRRVVPRDDSTVTQNVFRHAGKTRVEKTSHHRNDFCMPGAYKSVVGIVSVGSIARKLIELLKPFDVRVVVSCPFLSSRIVNTSFSRRSEKTPSSPSRATYSTSARLVCR